jgi:acetyl-CoA acetyltransferase
MVAIYQAARALMNHDCDAALAGGVNVISSPEVRSVHACTFVIIFLLTNERNDRCSSVWTEVTFLPLQDNANLSMPQQMAIHVGKGVVFLCSNDSRTPFPRMTEFLE